jgi:hypothetical protein
MKPVSFTHQRLEHDDAHHASAPVEEVNIC